MVPEAWYLIQQVEFFAWLEAHGPAGRDADFRAGSGVASDARFAGFDGKDAKSTQLDAIASAECGFHGLEDYVDGSFCLGARETRTLDYPLNQVLLDHGAYLSFCRGRRDLDIPACDCPCFRW
jgi:hypothetical protein